MEAATTFTSLTTRRRIERFERECERLRPLGEAYVLRRFGGQLGRADAEEAVAEVLIRLHRQLDAGRPPQNLRAAFFTAVRNASIDILRSRQAKPTVGLEAVLDAPALSPLPGERAESRDDAVRLTEALARMRRRYREAILLRFGLGMTVPEIAAHLEISLPAAKKLILRATAHVRDRLAAIEGAEFCPEMQRSAHRSLFEREAAGLSEEGEAEVLRAHLAHCGPCRTFLAGLHDHLHELGGAAVLGLAGGARLGGLTVRVSHAIAHLAHPIARLPARGRELLIRAQAPLSSGQGAAGAVMASGQKIAAICGAGAAATATCLLTGAVGPGLGASAPPPSHPHHRPARAAQAFDALPAPVATVALPSSPASEPAPESKPAQQPAPPPSEVAPSAAPAQQPPRSEFGLEGSGTPAGAGAPSEASATPKPPAEEPTESHTAGGGSRAGRSPSGSGVGFSG